METTVVQGRELTGDDIGFIHRLIGDNPSWSRRRISLEICAAWDWRSPAGLLKDMACRSMLLKLEERGLLALPERRPHTPNHLRNLARPFVPHSTDPIVSDLEGLTPVELRRLEGEERSLFSCLLATYHYLGFGRTVGENMAYMAFDRYERPLAALLFGSAAWRCAPRDSFLGWNSEVRAANLNLVTNNTRFLILPWVQAPNLASHLLARSATRLDSDWQDKYRHPVHMLETFVERDRFTGACYRAANWTFLGSTKGRTRNDRAKSIKAPVKDVYVLGLTPSFREALCN